jgi:hypothetical protein
MDGARPFGDAAFVAFRRDAQCGVDDYSRFRAHACGVTPLVAVVPVAV